MFCLGGLAPALVSTPPLLVPPWFLYFLSSCRSSPSSSFRALLQKGTSIALFPSSPCFLVQSPVPVRMRIPTLLIQLFCTIFPNWYFCTPMSDIPQTKPVLRDYFSRFSSHCGPSYPIIKFFTLFLLYLFNHALSQITFFLDQPNALFLYRVSCRWFFVHRHSTILRSKCEIIPSSRPITPHSNFLSWPSPPALKKKSPIHHQ